MKEEQSQDKNRKRGDIRSCVRVMAAQMVVTYAQPPTRRLNTKKRRYVRSCLSVMNKRH